MGGCLQGAGDCTRRFRRSRSEAFAGISGIAGYLEPCAFHGEHQAPGRVSRAFGKVVDAGEQHVHQRLWPDWLVRPCRMLVGQLRGLDVAQREKGAGKLPHLGDQRAQAQHFIGRLVPMTKPAKALAQVRDAAFERLHALRHGIAIHHGIGRELQLAFDDGQPHAQHGHRSRQFVPQCGHGAREHGMLDAGGNPCGGGG